MARHNARDPEQYRLVVDVTHRSYPDRTNETIYGPYKTAGTARGVLKGLRKHDYLTLGRARIEKSQPAWIVTESNA